MTRLKTTGIGALLLVAYVSCLVLAEFVHSHHQARPGPREIAFSVHSCGDVEIHRPLDWLGQCTLCRDGHGRSFAVVQGPAGDGSTVTPLIVHLPSNEKPPPDARSHPGITRGPPAI